MKRRGIADRRASVAMIVAIAALPLILCVGLATDATRLWLVRTRLQQSVDAAALLAAMETGTASQVADVQKLFWVNFSRNGFSQAAGSSNAGFMGATSSGAAVTTVDSTHVQVTAQANVTLTFMSVAHNGTVSVVGGNAIAQSSAFYEIALALDVTGSMLQGADGSTNPVNPPTKIQAVKTAVANMLSVVYGSTDTVQNLWVSVVPFRGSVNIGTQNQPWLGKNYKPQDWSAQAWRGCVEARRNGYDLTEDDPKTQAFTPLLWPSTYHVHTYQTCSSSGACTTNYSYGDNDWYAGNTTDTGDGNAKPPWYSVLPVGPNLGCSNGTVLPLTASKSTVSAQVTNLVAASGGSTVLSQALQWAWFTVSPAWQSDWGLTPARSRSPRPLAYSTSNLHKVIILLTDGQNQWDGIEQLGFYSAGDYCYQLPNVWPECVQTDGYYSSYGRLSANRVNMVNPGGTPPQSSIQASQNAASALNSLTSQICTSIKAIGITIYTIGVGAAPGSADEAVLKSCATDSAHYYGTTNGNDISNAFVSIGQQLRSLRLTQ